MDIETRGERRHSILVTKGHQIRGKKQRLEGETRAGILQRKKSKKEELVEADDLEVGDRVSVYWNDENKEWYDGEVDSIKKGKVHVAYDDGSDDFIDPKIHTKIKRLAK